MIETTEQLIKHHLPGRSKDTLACYEMWEHEDYLEYDKDTGELIGLISYFKLDFKFDMIIAMNRDNIFSMTQWRILRNTIKNRVKPLRIQSDPNNPTLQAVVKRLGGKFINDEIYFN